MTKKLALQSLPAKFEVPALGLIRKAVDSVTGLWIACRMFEKIGPTMPEVLRLQRNLMLSRIDSMKKAGVQAGKSIIPPA